MLYADAPLLRSVAMSFGTEGVDNYHADNGRYALKGAKPVLGRAGVAITEKVLVGDPHRRS